MSKRTGFTLAELLIALAILGVIATFTIPKVLNGQQSSEYQAIAQESMAMLTAAYNAYKLDGAVSGSTRLADLTPYMNYVGKDTSTAVDHVYNFGTTLSCSTASFECYRLHNGAMFWFRDDVSFDGTGELNSIYYQIDPDGKVTGDGGATSNGRALQVWLYYNGRLTTRPYIENNTCNNFGCANNPANLDPPWFSW